MKKVGRAFAAVTLHGFFVMKEIFYHRTRGVENNSYVGTLAAMIRA